MISRLTLKKAFERALEAFAIGALAAFSLIPFDPAEPKKYLYALFIGMITGGIMGLKKFVKGYLKYDKEE